MFACAHYPPALITLRYATGEQIHSYYFQLTACLLDRFKNFQLTLANRWNLRSIELSKLIKGWQMSQFRYKLIHFKWVIRVVI